MLRKLKAAPEVVSYVLNPNKGWKLILKAGPLK